MVLAPTLKYHLITRNDINFRKGRHARGGWKSLVGKVNFGEGAMVVADVVLIFGRGSCPLPRLTFLEEIGKV